MAEAKAKQEAEEESARMRAEQETAAMMAARVAAVEGDAKVARCVDGVLAARGKIEFGTALAALIAARSRCWHDNGWEAWLTANVRAFVVEPADLGGSAESALQGSALRVAPWTPSPPHLHCLAR